MRQVQTIGPCITSKGENTSPMNSTALWVKVLIDLSLPVSWSVAFDRSCGKLKMNCPLGRNNKFVIDISSQGNISQEGH